MVLLGCKPKGRSIEQHDIFFGIGTSLKELIPAMQAYWPEAKGKIHIDSWREVTYANGYKLQIKKRTKTATDKAQAAKLYFINLGGYKSGDLEEYHYKMVVAAPDRGAAVMYSKQTAFYKHTGFKGATSHIDDKYGIDVDDANEISELLSAQDKSAYSIHMTAVKSGAEDELHIGYLKLDKVI